MHEPLAKIRFELKAELASGHYLHLQHGILCYGEQLKAGVIRIQNAPLDKETEVLHLTNLINDTKDPVAAVKIYLMESADVKTEIVLGTVCTTALWCSKNLATFSKIAKNTSPSLHQLNQALKFFRFNSGEVFPENVPLARIPDLQEFNARTRMVFYHSETTGVNASRYSLWSTHNNAIDCLNQERIVCGVETKSYQLLTSSFLYSRKHHSLHLFIPRDIHEVEMENKCIRHFEEAMEMIDPAIKVKVELVSHALL